MPTNQHAADIYRKVEGLEQNTLFNFFCIKENLNKEWKF